MSHMRKRQGKRDSYKLTGENHVMADSYKETWQKRHVAHEKETWRERCIQTHGRESWLVRMLIRIKRHGKRAMSHMRKRHGKRDMAREPCRT